jgi:hypothetical protein
MQYTFKRASFPAHQSSQNLRKILGITQPGSANANATNKSTCRLPADGALFLKYYRNLSPGLLF